MNKTVVGIGFGDEGKGSTVSYLTSTVIKPLIIRYSGGHQAGHTVVYKNQRHVFSTFGAGTLQSAPTLITNTCVVSPIHMANELEALLKLRKQQHFNIKLFIDKDTPVTTPFEIATNQSLHKFKSNGTTGLGVGSTINREEANVHLTFGDLYNKTIFNLKMSMIKSNQILNIHPSNEDLDHFDKCVDLITRATRIIEPVNQWDLISHYENSGNIICESSQGVLLDPEAGFFPHVTRIPLRSKEAPVVSDQNYFVTRAYQTRHGNGPMTNEIYDIKLKNNQFETNVTNKWQGEFRVSILDLDLLKYALSKESKTDHSTLVITCLDQLTEYSYSYEGEIITLGNERMFIYQIAKILEFKHVIVSRSPIGIEMEEFYMGM